MKKVLSLILTASVVCAAVLTGCAVEPAASEETQKPQAPGTDIVVGAIYVGRRTETDGYTNIHNQAITGVMRELEIPEDNLMIVDNVEENEIIEAVEQLAVEGCNIIFGISEEYDFPMSDAAEMFPEIMFCSLGGFLSNDKNLIDFYGSVYQASYLAGINAGYESLAIGNNDIGYVYTWGDEDTQSYACVNAFALGAMASNPDAVIHLDMVHVWEDDELLINASNHLASCGCGVIFSHRDVFSVINWSVFYETALKAAMNCSAASDFFTEMGGNYYGNLTDGFINTEPITAGASAQAVEAIGITESLIESGQWDVFSGTALRFTGNEGSVTVSQVATELEDSEGNTIVEAGAPSLTEAMIRVYMNYFVDGVIDET